MRVIVTGATSFIGKAVTKELLAGGHHVFAVVRPDSPGRGRLEQPGAEAGEKAEEETGEETGNKAGKKAGKEGGRITVLPFALKDIGKLDACPELVSCPVLKSRSDLKTKADLWLHLGWEGAGSANRQDPHVQARNIGYALDSLHTAARLGCVRFLFCGSQAEYGIADGVMGEEILCHPVSEYGKDKLEVCRRAGEEAKALGIDYIHARIFSVYGPGDHPWSLVSTCLNTFLKG
ncbi:NAD-dependent epimerase/dehydratase family protein, partial [Enterocloster bolteae]